MISLTELFDNKFNITVLSLLWLLKILNFGNSIWKLYPKKMMNNMSHLSIRIKTTLSSY
jgi:hypothetical protein